MRQRRLQAALAAAALVTSSMLAATTAGAVGPAATAVITPVTSAIFNDPLGDAAAQKRIRKYVVDLIGSADSGSRIDVSAMVFADDSVAQALVEASTSRSVHVRVVVDSAAPRYTDTTGYDRLTRAFKDFDALTATERKSQSWIQTCALDRACLASVPATRNPLNHNKFFLFSSIGGQRVVVESSENLGVSNLWNNALTVVGDGPLFDHFTTYFNRLARADHDLSDVYSSYGGTGSVSSSKVWFFPRPKSATGTEASNDTVGDILANVACKGANIKVGMRNLERPRIASDLLDCAREGAQVEIVYDTMTPEFRDIIEGSANITRYRMPDGRPGVHSKYMIVDGVFAGTGGKWIFTGSHNYDRDSLRDNDESLVRLNNSRVYADYAANIEAMKRVAVKM